MNNGIDYKALNIDSDILAKAWDGDAVSQLLLGKACFNAACIGDSFSYAFKWIHRSAEQGNMEAQFRLADLFALGKGAPKSYKDAYEWYTKAALQGYRKASIRIFNLYQQDRKMYSRGRLNLEEDEWADRKFLKRNNSRELNEYRLKHHESKLNHAIDYYSEQFNVLKSGNQKDPGTSFKLGFLYQYGYGVKKCIKLAIDYYTEAAEQGNRDAQYHLGFLYEHDTNIKFNYYIALKWYRVSATSGNIASQNALGYFYEKGLATALNFEGAIYWYSKAANAGNSDAQLTLGKLYRKGEGVDVNMSKAIEWYTLAANQGNGAAQNCLNQLYQNGKKNQVSVSENNTGYVGEHQTKPTLRSKLQDEIEKFNSLPNITQLKKLVEHALRTDGNAMYKIGMKYFNGEDFTQDKDIGFQWIKKAAKTGLQEAELKVAEMYEAGGDVVDQDYQESSIWTAKVAKQKNHVARCDLGLLYLHGKGVRKDPLEASKWFTISADQGNVEAQYQFGLLRFQGLGLRKDEKEGLEWFHRSALSGNTNALYQLGMLYERGENIEKDTNKAIKLYEYSANNGNHNSQVRLAQKYEEGDLVDQDLQKAEKYYGLAAISFDESQQYEFAKKYMNGVFGSPDYTKAFGLFKKIADEEPSSDKNIFRKPIILKDEHMDYSKLVDMLMLISKRGHQEICYDIGYFYENGLYSEGKTLFKRSYTDAMQLYFAAATNGDSRAQYRLGVMYEEGKGVKVDLSVAYNHYLEAYENGIDGADYRLALMYLYGKCAAQDFLKAYCLFTEASNRGHKKAYKQLIPSEISYNLKMLEAVANAGYVAVQYQLGVFYQEKRESDEEALKWLSLASNGGVADAFYRLGVIYEELKGNDQNYSKAIQLYLEAIAKDHEDAMYRLAQIYHLGKGVKRDYQKAYDLYSRAAELGHNKSSRILDFTKNSAEYSYTKNGAITVLYYPSEIKSILLMFEFLAKQGNVHLQYQLGTFYIANKRHLNYNDAFKWFQMAASKENTNAVYQLGLLHENGQGTIQDHSAAYRLYLQAKEKGHKDAIYRLGIAYQYGSGVNINTSEAIRCYMEAAELGSDESQYKLGKLYESGELVEKDTLKVLKWYTKAYLNGNCDVIKDLHQLYDEKPLELYFNERLFRMLSNVENTYKPDDQSLQEQYGFFYFKLGMMYLNGQGTAKNLSKALKQLLKAYYEYSYYDAGPYISLEYNPHTLESQNFYIENLNAYLEFQTQIPSNHQYRLGMLYYGGIQKLSLDYNIPRNPVLAPNYYIAFQYFNLASLQNHPRAQDQIGLMYLHGCGVKKDYQIALKWFTAASESMEGEGCYHRGLDFYSGRSVKKDYEIAAIYFQKTVKENYEKAQTYLDRIYFHKLENSQHESKAMDKIAEKISPSSLYDRGVALYENSSEGVKKRAISSFYIKKAVEKNHKKAIAQLGKMYLEGRAVEKDENEALKWAEKSIEVMDTNECYEQGMDFYEDEHYKISILYLKKVAEENNGWAQADLGLMYLRGLGVDKNHEQAMNWFERSTIQLSADSCRKKGIYFYESVEVDNNYDIALLYFRNAAEENCPIAQAQLGIMYLHGLGVEWNYNKAREWIKSSVKNMDESDCYEYGMKFRNGIEVEKNYTIASAFLRKAANQSHGRAQAQLGLMYLNGHGVQKNESEGMELIEESLKNMERSQCYKVGIHLYNLYESEKRFEVAMLFIKQSGKEGNALAQTLLGEMYIEGRGIQKNQDEALNLIKTSTERLGLRECYDQGMKYYRGFEVERNYNVAMLYLQTAQLRNYPLAQIQVGVAYLEGHGVEKSKEKAMECFKQSMNEMEPMDSYLQGMALYKEYRYDISLLYFRRAAEAGYNLSQFQLGIMLREDKVIEKNQFEAYRWIEGSMESMTPKDCYDQGMALYRGTMVTKDYTISFRLMKIAAVYHHGLARAHLALIYYQGLGVKKNKNEALELVKQAIEGLRLDYCNKSYIKNIMHRYKRYEDEYYEQGVKFYYGIEVDPDYEIALLYLRKAAECCHGPSQAQLALMYLEGSGVEKNYGVAMELIDKSMNNMELDECYRQGMIFYHRTELENNYNIALQYLQRASKANAYAQAQLGYMYKNGIGVDINHEEAARWHNIVENNYVGDSRYCRTKIHHYDQGGMQDFSKALKLYQEELEAFFHYSKPSSISGSLRGVGLLYEYGDGVTQDFKKAMKYYGRSASVKSMTAYYSIGLFYYYGKGVDKNYKEAFIWFTKAASLTPNPKILHVFVEENADTAKNMTGSSKRTYSLQPESRIYGESHYYIGLMYNNGYGVDRDEERAQNYFKIAHINGVEHAKQLL